MTPRPVIPLHALDRLLASLLWNFPQHLHAASLPTTSANYTLPTQGTSAKTYGGLLDFLLAHPLAGAGLLHRQWCEAMTAEGWRFNATYDPRFQYHPCLQPFEDLDPLQRLPFEIFVTVVETLTPAPVPLDAYLKTAPHEDTSPSEIEPMGAPV